MDAQDLHNLSEAYREVYDNIMEREDSPYEKASDAALDARYGYGRATGDKRSFGRAANRASAAAMLRRLRRDRDEGRSTSRESGADAVHQGWAHTARTSADQTPEKKERRAKLADTSYSNLPDDEKEKDRVSADAVRAVYNRNKSTKKEEVDIYDIIFSHLLDEGYADTNENALVIMANMSEDWMEDIVEAYKELPVGKMRKQIIKHAASGTKRAFLSNFRGQKGTTAGNVEDAKAMKSLNKAKKIQGEIENREKMGSDFYQGSREGRALANKRRGR